MNEQVYSMLMRTYKLCDTIQNAIPDWTQDRDLKEILKTDLLRLGMYISASDGTISCREAEALSEHFDISLTPAQISEEIRSRNIYSTEFENTVPLSFQIFTALENQLAGSEEMDITPTDAILEVYAKIARMIVSSDGDISAEEQADWEIYSRTLDNFLNENLNSRKGPNTGPGQDVPAPKKTGAVPAPKKNESVPAPKKR